MKTASYIVGGIMVMGSLMISSCRHTPVDTAHLIGLPKDDALNKLGKPSLIEGPEAGCQTYEYTNSGLSVVFAHNKVVQFMIGTGSSEKTSLGIGIGATMPEVTKLYGDYTREEEVQEWFGGNVPRVLYHHRQTDRYKINYPEKDLLFQFDKDKRVEVIVVGYIFPVEQDKKP